MTVWDSSVNISLSVYFITMELGLKSRGCVDSSSVELHVRKCKCYCKCLSCMRLDIENINFVILIRQRKHSASLEGTSDSENTSDWNMIYLNRRCIFRKHKLLRHWNKEMISTGRGKLLLLFSSDREESSGDWTPPGPRTKVWQHLIWKWTWLFLLWSVSFSLLLLSLKWTEHCFLLMLLCSSFLHRLRRWWYIWVVPRWQSILKRRREHDDETQAGKPTTRSVKPVNLHQLLNVSPVFSFQLCVRLHFTVSCFYLQANKDKGGHYRFLLIMFYRTN